MELREPHQLGHSVIREFILGWQDGLVNVLALILGIATAVSDAKIVIIAGLAATFAESISMAAVAYTSQKASWEFYKSELEREKREIKELPKIERKEIYDIYYAKGFRGTMLNKIVSHIVKDDKRWLDIMMKEELNLFPEQYEKPAKAAALVGFSAVIGSLIPLIPFLLLPVSGAVFASVVISITALFIAGAVKARITVGRWWKSGLELAVIGGAAALVGYVIGYVLGVAV